VAGTSPATGNVDSTDADDNNPDDQWQAVSATNTTSGYGKYAVDALGQWSYTLNETNSAVEGLKNFSDILTDNFTIATTDGNAATTNDPTQLITVTIHGANDAAVVTGDDTGTVAEAGGVLNATAGIPSIIGDLGSTDVDTADADDAWSVVSTAINTVSGYGKYTIDATGHWTYALNETNSAVEGLSSGDVLADSFTVTTTDGTSKTVNITINGANDAAVIGGTATGTVTEAGGIGNATGGNSPIGGDLNSTDVDLIDFDDDWSVVSTAIDTASGYGKYTIDATGHWTYALKEGNVTVQALNNLQSTTDSFTVSTSDGTTKTVSVVINGNNDAASITGTLSGTATEDSVVGGTVTGTLTATDVDNVAGWTASTLTTTASGKGSYSITAAGVWTYVVDNSNPTVNGLNNLQSTNDSFVVTTPGGDSRTVTVTINGTNDVPVVSGSSTGTVIEAGGLLNALPGTPSVTNSSSPLTYTDVDNSGPYTWTAVNTPTLSNGQFGTYTATAAGVWTYNLNNANGQVQGLKGTATLTDTFGLATVDGTTQTVSVTITGQNDVAVISGPSTGTVIEAGGVGNAITNTPTATGNLDSLDVDDISDLWQSVGVATATTFGTYTLGANGAWTYNLDNTNTTIQALNLGGIATDSFVATTIDGTTKVVSITINGRNDTATILAGGDTGSVIEAGNLVAGTIATANLNATDVDNLSPNSSGDNWTVVQNPITTASGKGNYSIDVNGVWTYTVNNGNSTVNALNVGQTTTDTFAVTTTDGTSKTVSVTINGTNDAAVISGPSTGSVIESNGSITSGTPNAIGDLNFTDVDNASNNDVWNAVNVPAVSNNLYGTYTIDASGNWNYEVNNLNGNVQSLQTGQILTDSFSVTTFDGTSQTVTVTINGVNDNAIISGALAATLTESTPSTTGNLTSVDVDNTSDVWQAVTTATNSVGGYGTYTIDADGVWTYNLNTSNVAVDGLNVNQTLTDTFTVKTVDGLTPATGTPQVVTITITGQNDAAIITNAVTAAFGTATEASGINNGTPGTTATGNLNATDVDNIVPNASGDNWTVVQNPIATASGKGSYSIDVNGVWTYTIDNGNSTVNALNVGQNTSDSFTVTTVDGQSQTVNITINGANDASVITGSITGTALEAGGVNNGTPGTTATGTLISADVDSPNIWTASSGTNAKGSYSITSGGVWTYTIDNSNSAIQALNGSSTTDTFAVTTFDGTSQTVTVTINGANDAAVITGSLAGTVVEDAISNTVTGTLLATDVDNAAGWTASSGTNPKGSYSITTAGVWTYTLNNTNSVVNALNVGQSTTDTFTVATPGGDSRVVTVTITGTNDAAVVTNFTGAVIEAGAANGGIVTATATLNVVDPDDTYPGWTAQTGTGTYGSYTLNSAGTWTYNLDNLDVDTQALNAGQSATDTFLAVNGGLSQTVTVNITGANDNPAPNGSPLATLATVAENVAPYTIAKAQLLQGFGDVDAGQTVNVGAITSPVGTFALNGAGTIYTFTPTNPDYNGVVNLAYSVIDGAGGVYAATSSFTITAVNDAPTALSTTASLASVDEDTTNPAGATVLSLFGSTFSDAKDNPAPNTFAGVAITSVTSNPDQGLWQWLDVNNAWQAISSVSTSGALFLNTATKIRFLPTANFNGVPNSIEARLVEPGALNLVGNLVTTGDLTNVSGPNSGGSTHVSDSPNTVVLSTSINPIDDPTTITGNTSGTVTEDTAISFVGSLVATDPDVSGPLFTPVTNQNGANNYGKFTILNNGTWQYNLDNNNPLVQHLGAANSLNDTYTFNTITGASQTVNVTINGSIDAGVSITGTSASELINGKDGNDTINGGDGNDTLDAGLGNDVLDGGNGNDSLLGGAGNDVLIDYGDGIDALIGGTGDDVYAVVSSGDSIVENANEGTDSVWTNINYSLAANVENSYLVGSISVTGNDADNFIYGYLEGDNTINGGNGNDTLDSGLGNDVLDGGNGNDSLLGGAGNDVIIDYGDGIDALIGGTGDDVYAVVSSGDSIVENAGEGIDSVWTNINYSLTANVENLYLVGSISVTGNDADNFIYGYAEGDNTINGGNGNDTLNGGAGTDVISGGAGADIFTFLFTQSTATATDRITDFEIGVDKLDIFTPAGVAATPASFKRALDDSTSVDLSSLANGVYTGGLAAGAAALVVSTGSIAGTYIVIDDGIAGFNATNDLVINITGATGTLPTNPTSVSSFFKV
jgi:VCBS repeat-containing protein